MKTNTIEEVIHKLPFQPFVIEYNGKPVRVDHPDQTLLNADGNVLVVATPDNHLHLLDVDHIKAITLSPRRRKAAV